jgi:hypothetical protein
LSNPDSTFLAPISRLDPPVTAIGTIDSRATNPSRVYGLVRRNRQLIIRLPWSSESSLLSIYETNGRLVNELVYPANAKGETISFNKPGSYLIRVSRFAAILRYVCQ